MQPFNQPPPQLPNQYDDDRVLRSHLRRVLPPEVLAAIEPELQEMGRLAAEELRPMQLADRLNDPVLTQWNAWGERIDEIEVSPLWRRAAEIAATHGVVAAAYDPTHGAHARTHQFALAYLFHPNTDVYTCPLAMTDGAARTLLDSGNQALAERAVPRLISRDPEQAWTSGQWMTESTGGSDVGRSETVARQGEDGTWRLYGRKWFTSAITSQMALTLARPEGNGPGGAGLALFFVETHGADGRPNALEVLRLKDKLGTRKVPTAELMLRGTPAIPVKGLAQGTRNISPMLHVTRTWNAVTATAFMRHGIALARDFARRRIAFGAPLSEKPLHLDTMAWLQAEFEAAFQLTFRVVQLLGLQGAGQLDAAGDALLRLLTPLMKLTTGRQAVDVLSEAIEAFGGAGYVEDTGLPMILRDAHVLPIWEGTTNVLSLDTLRALGRDGGMGPLLAEVERVQSGLRDPSLVAAGEAAMGAIRRAGVWLAGAMLRGRPEIEAGARRFALTLGRSMELALLLEHAQWSLDVERDGRARAAAQRFLTAGVDRLAEVDRAAAAALADDRPMPV